MSCCFLGERPTAPRGSTCRFSGFAQGVKNFLPPVVRTRMGVKHRRGGSRVVFLERTPTSRDDAAPMPIVPDYPTLADVNLTYDLASRLIQSIDGTGTRTYTYDNLGRRTAKTDPPRNPTGNFTPTHPGGVPVPNMRPVDEIDGCCQDHDNRTAGMWNPIATRDADCKLYRCAKTKSCRGDALCEIAKADIIKFASALCLRPMPF